MIGGNLLRFWRLRNSTGGQKRAKIIRTATFAGISRCPRDVTDVEPVPQPLASKRVAVGAIPSYVRSLYRNNSIRSNARSITMPKNLIDAWEKRYGPIEEVEIRIDGEDIVLRPVKGQEPLDAAE